VIKFHHAVDAKDCYLRITKDGAAAETWHTATDNMWNLICINTGDLGYKLACYDWGLVGFDTALKVEIKSGDAGFMRAYVMYQLFA